MIRSEVIEYLFGEELIDKFKNNLGLLQAYGIVGVKLEDIWYTDILKELKGVIEWLNSKASNEEVVRWAYFFNQIIGIKDKNKFIMVIQNYDMNMGWK